ncbi:DUF1203 domain-containing protein [Vibrio profundum]|uniref:DUF1203 domain-containing protein n=1 Tax=Vibrio profundum TaxID=2910247 RepID=UPI003D0F6372
MTRTDFIIKAIEKKHLSELSGKNNNLFRNARWTIAKSKPGYPCRVSLKEAEIGESILVVTYKYHDVDSPYQASGPIFIRENAETAKLKTNEIPEILAERLLSVRAYNLNSEMIAAETTQGLGLRRIIQKQFLNSEAEYLQVHNANPGCFSCNIFRV